MVARFTNIEPKISVLLRNNRLRILTKTGTSMSEIPVFSSWLFNSLPKVTGFNTLCLQVLKKQPYHIRTTNKRS